jgi:hypothetical protein
MAVLGPGGKLPTAKKRDRSIPGTLSGADELLKRLTASLEEKNRQTTVTDDGSVIVPIEMPDTTDIGEYCVECRRYVGEDTEWFKARKPHIHVNDDDSRIKGFLCEPCQPLEGTLMEPIIAALVQRRYDETLIRKHIRLIGEETLFEELVGPMLDMFETLLQLERK